MRLPKLANASLVVTPEFRSAETPSVVGEPVISHEGDGDAPDLDRVREVLESFVGNDNSGNKTNDGEPAIAVHQVLPLTRREAATAEFWHYVSVMVAPRYVVWRWQKDGVVPKERFVGNWERNAVGRLWWLAELTRDNSGPDPYDATRRAGNQQEFFLWTVDTFLCRNQYFMRAMIDECLGDEPLNGDQIRALFKSAASVGGSQILELLDEQRVRDLVRATATGLRIGQ